MFETWDATRYEKILYESLRPKSLAARCAGIARAIRISHQERLAPHQTAHVTAAGLVGPLVFCYAWWLLRSVCARKIHRIYFMARDGQIFMEAARELIAGWGLDLDIRYLYCSRESLFLPSYENTGKFELYWIPWGYAGTITLAEVCRRVGLRPGELPDAASASSRAPWYRDPHRAITLAELPELYALLQEPELEELIRQRSRPLFDDSMAYFRQEGLTDGTPFVLADTGWRGSSQYALSALLHKAGQRPPDGLAGYYFGLNRETHLFGNDRMQAFLFDWRDQPRDYRLYYFICFEMLFAADHGRTIRYRRHADRLEPLLADTPDRRVAELIGIHHAQTVAFARQAAAMIGFDEYPADLPAVAAKLARAFICTPTKREAEAYGEWPIASEIREGDFQPIAPPMGAGRFFNCALGREKISGFWPQASLARGGQPLICATYNRFLDMKLLDWYRRVILRY